MSEILLDPIQLKPFSNAQLLGISCVSAIVGDAPYSNGLREAIILFNPNYTAETYTEDKDVRYIIASTVTTENKVPTHLLAIYNPIFDDSVIDVGDFIEALTIEPYTGETRYTSGFEAPGEVCADEMIVDFIVRNGILSLVERIVSSRK